MVPDAFSMDWFDLPVRRWLRPLCYLLILRLENVAERMVSDEGKDGQSCFLCTRSSMPRCDRPFLDLVMDVPARSGCTDWERVKAGLLQVTRDLWSDRV